MEEKKPLKYTEDWEGDKSSKRLMAFILLSFSLSIALFVVVFDAIKGWQSYELIKYIFSFSLGGSLLSLGLTIPEMFSKK